MLILLLFGMQSYAQETMSLQEFLKSVEQENLDLKTADLEFSALAAQAKGVRLDPPQISFNQLTTESGERLRGFEVSQSAPFPIKLIKSYQARQSALRGGAQTRLDRRSEVRSLVKTLYFQFWGAKERLGLLTIKKKALEDHMRLARSTQRSDSFSGIHTLKVESDIDALENEIEVQKQKIRSYQIELATSMNKDPTFVFVPIEPPLSLLPAIVETENSHQIQALQSDVKTFQLKESEAKASWFPEFNLRYKEMETSGRDSRYQEITLGLSLPFIFFWETNANVKVASVQKMHADLIYEKAKRKIKADVVALHSKVNALKQQLTTLNTRLIPRAKKRLVLARNLSPRDLETLQDHRETMEALPDLQLKALELRLSYEEAISKLERYTGRRDL